MRPRKTLLCTVLVTAVTHTTVQHLRSGEGRGRKEEREVMRRVNVHSQCVECWAVKKKKALIWKLLLLWSIFIWPLLLFFIQYKHTSYLALCDQKQTLRVLNFKQNSRRSTHHRSRPITSKVVITLYTKREELRLTSPHSLLKLRTLNTQVSTQAQYNHSHHHSFKMYSPIPGVVTSLEFPSPI